MSKSKLADALVRVVRAPFDAAHQRFDAWVNNVTGFGTSQDKTTFGEVLPSRILTDQELSSLYHSDDMAERMVDVYPNEMLREGFSIETGSAEADAIISDKLEALDVIGNFTAALRWGRLFGAGAVLIGADDGRDASKPLVAARAKSIAFLHAFDRRLLWPLSYYTEDGHPKLGQAETYAVSREGAAFSRTSVVHESRLIIFGGAPTADREKLMLNGWDQSCLQRAYDVLRSFNTGWKSVETMMTDGNQPIFKMTGLADMIASTEDGEKALVKRLQMMSLYRSVMRALVIDADSNESFERASSSFTDIPNVLDKLMLRLAATQEMPVTLLMGQSPAGMNATGEADFRWFFNRVDSKRKRELTPPARRLVRIFLDTKEGREIIRQQPKTIRVRLPDLWKETPLAAAQRRKTLLEGDALAVQAQMILPDEAGIHRFSAADGFEGELRFSPEGTKARLKALSADLERLESGAPAPGEEDEGGPMGGGGGPFGGGGGGGAGARFDQAPRPFQLHRHEDETGVSGTGIVADGCVFEDGTCVVRWRTATASTTVFEPKDGKSGTERMLEVHGHGGKTELVFLDEGATTRTDGGDDEPERDEMGRFTGNGGGGGGKEGGKSSGTQATASPIAASPASAADFKASFDKAMASNEKSAFVTHYSEEDLGKMSCFTAHDGKVGVALKDHGDGRIEATALFNNGGPPGSGRAMLAHAVSQGANYVECFAGTLDKLYTQVGFKEDSRSSFSKEYAPPNWNYARDGEPDYVTMRLKK